MTGYKFIKHRDEEEGRNTDQPEHQEKLKPQELNAQSSLSKIMPNIYLGPAKIWTLWFPAFQTFMKVPGNGSEHSKKKQLENFWPWVISKPCLQSAWEPPRWMTSSSNLASFKQWIGLRQMESPLTSIDMTSGWHWGLNTQCKQTQGSWKGNQWRKLKTPSPTSRNN